MKKSFIYLIPAIFLLAGCGKKISTTIDTNESTVAESSAKESIQETEKKVQNDVEMLKAHVYYKIAGDGNTIPQLSVEGNEKLNDIVKKINNDWVGRYYPRINLTRTDTSVFSALLATTVMNGSTDTKELLRGVNIDSNTGKELKIEDVLKDPTGLYDRIEKDNYLVDKYGEDIEGFSEKLKTVLTNPDAFNLGANDKADLAWTLSSAGIMIYMSAKDEYTERIVSIPLEFAKYGEFFKEDILSLPKDYAFEIPTDKEVKIDLDGKIRTVKIEQDIDEYLMLQEIDVTIDGEKSTYEEDASYGISKASLVKKGDNAYLYIELQYDNDYNSISIIDLDNKSGKLEISESFADTALLNPDEFYLGERIYTISTLGIEGRYIVGSKGMPKILENYYTITTPIQLTTKISIKAKKLDGINGKEVGDYDIPIGSVLVPVGTDKETFTDYTTSDGGLIRIPMGKASEYGFSIEGKNIEDVFDGTIFAG